MVPFFEGHSLNFRGSRYSVYQSWNDRATILVVRLPSKSASFLVSSWTRNRRLGNSEWKIIQQNTLPKTNSTAPENRPSEKETIAFQPSIVRCKLLVSGRVSSYVFLKLNPYLLHPLGHGHFVELNSCLPRPGTKHQGFLDFSKDGSMASAFRPLLHLNLQLPAFFSCAPRFCGHEFV